MLPRILMIHCRYQQYGGEDTVFDAELELLRSNGHEVETHIRDNKDIAGQARLGTAADALWSRGTVADVREIAARFRPDLIHVHNTFSLVSPSIYWIASRLRLPVVQTLHNYRLLCLQAMLIRDGKLCEDCVGKLPWRGVVRKCCRNSTAQSAVLAGMLGVHRAIGTYRNKITRYIALDESCRVKFIEGGLPAERIRIKPNFVSDPDVRFAGKRRGGLFVGRLSPEKGISTLVEAISLGRIEPVGVIGGGPDAAWLSGVGGVELLGFLSRPAIFKRLAAASWLVVPSVWYEPFGLVVVEAFACGTPVIASRIGALGNLVEDGVTGLLVKPGDPRELAEKMSWAQSHPAEMARMGAAARKRYEMEFTPAANYSRLIAIYREAMEATGFQARPLTSAA
jgi:glycosyltransferase involved in cell wall biosynthesis